jgi:SSS family solute:Na+ symporter
MVDQYREMKALEKKRNQTDLVAPEKERLKVLQEKYKRGEIKSFVSHINEYVFYVIYGGIVCLYTLLGGLMAATVTDTIQGILIIVFSLLLIPFGLYRVGGFSGLHEKVPESMFELFGSTSMSEYTIYMVLSLAFCNLVAIIANSGAFTVANAAKSEMDARFGATAGSFLKRFIFIPWALCGLLALALYGGKVSDPDLIWGIMTRDFLCPGLIGLMLVGIIAANMSSKDAQSVSMAALFTNNLYKPLIPDKPEKHYLIVSRIVIAVTLMGGIIAAITISNIVTMLKLFISFGVIFGAPIWLGLFWRRVTPRSAITQVIASILIIVILPNLVPAISGLRTWKPLLVQTNYKEEMYETKAKAGDVEAGLADAVGQRITKRRVKEPRGIYFQKVVRINPEDPNSPREGMGQFYTQVLIMDLLGMDFKNSTKADLETVRFLFNAIFPFVVMILVSLFTAPVPKKDLDYFYARKLTPVTGDPKKDEEELNKSYSDPDRFKSNKIFPNSSWEIQKPSKLDAGGFLICWVIVGIVILSLLAAMKLKWP